MIQLKYCWKWLKHHNPNPNPSKSIIFLNKYKYILLWTSENYTVTIRGCHVREIRIVFYFLLIWQDLPWLTLQVAANAQKDRQVITMASHIFTSKQIHYVYYTSQHWLFWIYCFCFFPHVKRPLKYDMYNERWTRNTYIFTITYTILGIDTFTHCWLWL